MKEEFRETIKGIAQHPGASNSEEQLLALGLEVTSTKTGDVWTGSFFFFFLR